MGCCYPNAIDSESCLHRQTTCPPATLAPIGARASCSASDEVWMAARLVMILTALDVLVRVGVRVACSDDSEQGGDEGKSAVSEGDLRQREAVGELAGDEAGEGGGAVADEVDDAEDRC